MKFDQPSRKFIYAFLVMAVLMAGTILIERHFAELFAHAIGIRPGGYGYKPIMAYGELHFYQGYQEHFIDMTYFGAGDVISFFCFAGLCLNSQLKKSIACAGLLAALLVGPTSNGIQSQLTGYILNTMGVSLGVKDILFFNVSDCLIIGSRVSIPVVSAFWVVGFLRENYKTINSWFRRQMRIIRQ